MTPDKKIYDSYDEQEILKSFIESLEKDYDYTPWGIGKAIAFLYDLLDELKKQGGFHK